MLAALPESHAAAPPPSPGGIGGGGSAPLRPAASFSLLSSRRNSENLRSTTHSVPSGARIAMAYIVNGAPFSSTAVREASDVRVSCAAIVEAPPGPSAQPSCFRLKYP
eukprot:scaffold282062_cov36-Tisochrysis_lutea.AAC.1